MSARHTIVRVFALVVGLAAVGGAAERADAAVGSYIRGVASCGADDGFHMRIATTAPYVRAANTTAYVDRQWVYWHARVVRVHLDISGRVTRYADTGWSQWGKAYAADNTWTRTTTFDNGSFTGLHWDLLRSGGLTYRVVENEVWYYSAGRWEFGARFDSAPSSTTGSVGSSGMCS